MSIQNLEAMSREQLVELAGKQGIPVHHKAKSETIIKQILDHLVTQSVNAQQNAVAESAKGVKTNKTSAPHHTPEEVEDAISHIKDKKPSFQSSYTGDTWHFRLGKSEDSGTLKQPLSVIVKKATLVARGEYRLSSLNKVFSDDISPLGGRNGYTNTVIG